MNNFIHHESHTVEDQAFLDGANGVPKEHGLSEIQGQCDRRKAEVRRDAAPVIQDLDAHAKTFRELANAAQEHWEAVKEEHGTNIPRLILPLFLLAASAVAVAAEGLILAPMLDMIGVEDRFGLSGKPWELMQTFGLTAERLAERYPAVTVDPGVLYADEGDVLTSAGVAAGIDLCLDPPRRDPGAEGAGGQCRAGLAPKGGARGRGRDHSSGPARQASVCSPGAGDGADGSVPRSAAASSRVATGPAQTSSSSNSSSQTASGHRMSFAATESAAAVPDAAGRSRYRQAAAAPSRVMNSRRVLMCGWPPLGKEFLRRKRQVACSHASGLCGAVA